MVRTRLSEATKKRLKAGRMLLARQTPARSAQAVQVARQAHSGLARAIAPYGTSLDGDIAFAVATPASGRTMNVRRGS